MMLNNTWLEGLHYNTMAKIRSLGNRELQQVLSLLERFSADEFNYPVLERFRTLYLPFHKLNAWLPLSWRFLPGIYVATEKDTVLGLIWLSKDGYKQDRCKIDQLIINPEQPGAYDVGKQLVQYVIHKYGAMGVETFLAYVDLHYSDGLQLLKGCGFRHCTKVHSYTAQPNGPVSSPKIAALREARLSDAKLLQELHSDTLVPEVRVSLQTVPADLSPPLPARLGHSVRGEFDKRWVVAPPDHHYLAASVALSTVDYKNFDFSLLVSPAWEHLTADLITFATTQVLKCTSSPILHTQVYDFQKTKSDALEKAGFERVNTSEILVKDYWIPLDDAALATKNPVLLFAKSGRTSPA